MRDLIPVCVADEAVVWIGGAKKVSRQDKGIYGICRLMIGHWRRGKT
jgi:hypothetical protein